MKSKIECTTRSRHLSAKLSSCHFGSEKTLAPFLLFLAAGLALMGAAHAQSVIMPGSTVTVSVSGGPGNQGDWVGLFRVGTPSDGFNTLAWSFLSGTHNYPETGETWADLKFVLPRSLDRGRYEFRLYASDNDFSQLLATGAQFTVGSGASEMPPSISAAPTQAGSTETISVSYGPGGTNDWVGLYRVGTPSDEQHLLAWAYLNGKQNAPSTGLSATTFNFLMPSNLSNLSGGLYEFRFYANDDFKEPLAISLPIRVGSGPQLHSGPAQ